MPRDFFRSKAVVSAFVILTVAVIAGIVTAIILYKSREPSTGRSGVRRLPKNLIPHSYRIFLQPHLYTQITEVANVTAPDQTMLFTGNSTVYFQCLQRTETIYLNSKELKVFDPVVMNAKHNEKIGVAAMKHHEDESDFLEIQLNEELEAGGNYSLFLAFKGEISEFLQALYVSKYNEGNPANEGDKKTERFLAVTNMEPADTRRLFPCFDEPEMKAVFYVTIIHRRDTIALANGGKSGSNIIDDDWQYTSFHPSPKMSTYLFAIAVSEFTSTPSPHERVEIKTFARPDATAAGHTQYAASITGKILQFYESYFEINYDLKTLAQIALPDLSPGAMENWGLITYQETALFYEEGVSTELHKHMVANIIAHELAHQWFGNLVTMKWWNQVWLNEGFATYMSNLAVNHAEPTFKMADTFAMGDLHAAFEADAATHSHPLSPPLEDVQTLSEIYGMFDDISYSKGSVVLRMLADTVGERVFHRAIKMYLSDFSYNNTDQNDLFEYIQKGVDEDSGHTKVAMVMESWTNQSGYPLITINTTNGEIYQKQYLLNNSTKSNRWWYVPIRVMSSTSESSIVWLESSGTVIKDKFIAKSGEWILANVNCAGFYRVNYNPENWQRLLTQLETDPHRIPVINRGQLIDDAFTLARAGLVDVTLALNATRFLRNETAYLPWDATVKNFEYFLRMFDSSKVYGPIQVYFRERVKCLYNSLRNYTDKSEVPKDQSLQLNQIIAIGVACGSGLPECIAMASTMFAKSMENNNTNNIHPNLRSAIYCQAVAAGGQKEWDFTWNKFQSAKDPFEKQQLRQALSCTRHIWLLNRYLEYTLNPEKIPGTQVTSTITSIANNVVGQALAWNFIKEHWDHVSQEYSEMLISGVTRRFSTQFELEELKRFLTDHTHLPTMVVNEALENTRVNVQWVNKHKDVVFEWFKRETAS